MAINYTFNVIGDCSSTSSGEFNLNISPTGNSLPVTINWIQPNTYPSEVILTNSYTLTGLSAGTYIYSLVDSNSPAFSASPLTFYISSSSTATLSVLSATTCGSDNGTLQVSMNSLYGNYATIGLYKNNELFSGYTSNTINYTITGLTEGIYHSQVFDNGGCNCVTNSVAVNDSVGFDFGFYKVNTPACYLRTGKLVITGITGGVPPYTYSWSADTIQWTTPPTGDTVTGLSTSNFSCTLTDSNGCSKTKTTQLVDAGNLAVINVSKTNPTCFDNNGSITYIISGGTPPYNYQLSNGINQILFSDTVTFNNLTSGNYELYITDAGLCNLTYTTFLTAPNTFTTLSTTSINSYCSFNDGSVNAIIQGGTPPYTFTIYNSTSSYTQNVTTFLGQNTFRGLTSDTYTLKISDKNQTCSYYENFTILNITNFDFQLNGQNTTCGYRNGVIDVSVTSATTATTNFQYYLSNGFQSSITTATTYSFSGLEYGFYSVSVRDVALNCTQTKTINIDSSSPPNLFLSSTSCLEGSGGTVSALIQGSEGNYNLTWSPNVNGQTGIFLTGLTAGTYTLTLSADSGCVFTESATVSCTPTNTYTFEYTLETASETNTLPGNLDFSIMVFSGYSNIVSQSETCLLNSYAISVDVTIGDTVFNFPFYFSNTLNNIPTFQEYCDFLQYSLLTIPHISSCSVNTTANTVTISTETVNGVEYYSDGGLSVNIVVDYNVNCESIQECPCTGLVLKLDAGNSNSYPGYGNTWYDLSSYGNNASISGNSYSYTTQYGGGIRINDNTSSDGFVRIPDTLNLNTLAETLNYTIIFGIKKEYYSDTASGISSILLGATNGYNLGWRIIESSTGSTATSFDGNYNISYGAPGLSSTTITLNSDVCIGMISRSNSNITFLFNGDITTSTTTSNYVSGGIGNSMSYKGFGVGALNGVLFLLYAYNRALSQSEMINMYNKLSTRFGL